MNEIMLLINILFMKRVYCKNIAVGKTNISYGSYNYYSSSKFNIKPMKILPKTYPSECKEYCNQNEDCKTVAIEWSTCQLFNESQYTQEKKYEAATSIDSIFSLMNTGCDAGKCKNNATCVPNYNNNTFRCECKPGYIGTLCQFPRISYPDWWFKFDGNTENTGLKKDDATITLTNKIGVVSFSGQPQKTGMFLRCTGECTKSTISSKEWVDPEAATDGITIAFWIRLHPGESERLNRIYIISTSFIGYRIYHDNKAEQWYFQLYLRKDKKYFQIVIGGNHGKPTEWQFIGFTWDSVKATGYVGKNATVRMKENTTPSQHTIISMEVSAYVRPLLVPNNPARFDIDDFRVWYRVLSSSMMKEIYEKDLKDMWLNA